MKSIFDNLSASCSKLVTRSYSTSFSLGILFLDPSIRMPIYNIYGFVRLADEIVDSFLDYNRAALLQKLRLDLVESLGAGISINPVLNSFQKTVRQYNIDWELIDTFMKSMEMDLERTEHNRASYEEYILGSAQVVGLMCLKVFTLGDETMYQNLKEDAMRLGSAFQKVNFLRDLNADHLLLGRSYFPGVNLDSFSAAQKEQVQKEIEQDFTAALAGIRKLPVASRRGVYVAYCYYRKLFDKIKQVPAEKVMKTRIRIDNAHKIGIMFSSLIRHQVNLY